MSPVGGMGSPDYSAILQPQIPLLRNTGGNLVPVQVVPQAQGIPQAGILPQSGQPAVEVKKKAKKKYLQPENPTRRSQRRKK